MTSDLPEVRFGRYVLRIKRLSGWDGLHLYDELAVLRTLGVHGEATATLLATCMLAIDSMCDATTGEPVQHYRTAFIEESKRIGFGDAISALSDIVRLSGGEALATTSQQAEERADFFGPTS